MFKKVLIGQIHYTEIFDFLDRKIDMFYLDGYSVHLWNEVFKRNFYNTELYPKGCWLDKMYRRYCNDNRNDVSSSSMSETNHDYS